MNSFVQRLSIGVLTCIVSAGLATSPALAETPVNTTAGDGGLVQKDCATGAEYVRIDSSELENSKACFFPYKAHRLGGREHYGIVWSCQSLKSTGFSGL